METLKEVQGVIFDLDGTLLDSTSIWQQIDQEFLAKRQIALPDDYIDTIHSMEFLQAATYTIKRFGLKETEKEILEQWHTLAIHHYTNTIKLKPYVKEYLSLLKKQNKKLGVATSLTEDLLVATLKNNEIYHLFSCFTTTEEVNKGKEFPDVYLLTANKLGLHPSNCIVFEDSLVGIHSAMQGGFLTIGVYDSGSSHEQDAILKESNYYIHSLLELL